MNGMERVLATLEGAEVDRRPVMPVLSLYGARLTGCRPDRYFYDPEAYVAGQAAVRQVFQPDALYGPFAFALVAEALGCEIRYRSRNVPEIKRPVAPSLDAFEGLEFPEEHPRLTFFQDAIEGLASYAEGQVPVIAIMMTPTEIPMAAMGPEAWMEAIVFDTERARRAALRTIPFFLHQAEKAYEAGASFIALPLALAVPTMMPRRLISSFVRPILEETLTRLGRPVLLQAAGAPLGENLDLLVGLPGVVAFALDEKDDLARVRQVLGPDPVLLGGPKGSSLDSRSPEEIGEFCRGLLSEHRADPRFMLCTSGADIPWSTPLENIHALRQAAEAV